MRTHDAADDPLASYFDDPVDRIEPEEDYSEETLDQKLQRVEREAYREAAVVMLVFLHSALAFVHEGRDLSERNIRLWVVSSAVSHPACEGRSDAELAALCGVTRANFSKHKLSFQRQNRLPPTLSQKSVKARQSYRESRHKQLAT